MITHTHVSYYKLVIPNVESSSSLQNKNQFQSLFKSRHTEQSLWTKFYKDYSRGPKALAALSSIIPFTHTLPSLISPRLRQNKNNKKTLCQKLVVMVNVTLNDREFLTLNSKHFSFGLTSPLKRDFISTQIKTGLGTKKETLWFGCLPYSRRSPNSNSAPP